MLLTSSTAAMAAAGRTESPAAPRNTAASTRSGAARAALARPDAIQQNASPRTPLFITYIAAENTVGYECDYIVNVNNPYIPIAGFVNECNYRVWLHEDEWNGSNWGTGWTYCISPGELVERGDLQAKYQNPKNIYISTNPDPC
jgi:hypothetical protein